MASERQEHLNFVADDPPKQGNVSEKEDLSETKHHFVATLSLKRPLCKNGDSEPALAKFGYPDPVVEKWRPQTRD